MKNCTYGFANNGPGAMSFTRTSNDAEANSEANAPNSTERRNEAANKIKIDPDAASFNAIC